VWGLGVGKIGSQKRLRGKDGFGYNYPKNQKNV